MRSLDKNVEKGFRYLNKKDYEESDREFRKADCQGGRALAAFKVRRYERALNQGYKFLKKGEDHFPYESETVLKAVKLSLDKIDPDEMQRDWVIPKAEEKIEGITWEEVNEKVEEFVEERPMFSGLMEDTLRVKALKEEDIEEAYELIKSRKLGESWELFADLHDTFPEDPFFQCCWAVSPGCVDSAPSDWGLNEYNRHVEHIIQLSEESSDEIEVSILAFCLRNISIWGGGDRGDVLDDEELVLKKSLEAFERSVELGCVKDSFYRYNVGVCKMLYEECEDAISSFEKVSESTEWYEGAKDKISACQELMKDEEDQKRIEKLLEKVEEAEEDGRDEDELEYLKQVDKEKFDELFIEDPIEIDERICELKIRSEGEDPAIETMKQALDFNPENELIVDYLIEEGRERMKDDDFERALDHFSAVPEGYVDVQFLEDYGDILMSMKRYHDAAPVYERLKAEDLDHLLNLAECQLHTGEREKAVKNLKEFFQKSSSVKMLERGLNIADDRSMLQDEELIEVCDDFLEKAYGDLVKSGHTGEWALSIKEEAEKRLEAKRREKSGELEKKGIEAFRSEDHLEAVDSFSEMHEDFFGPVSLVAMAKSLYHLKRYDEAMNWFEKIPDTLESISYKVDCCLKMGDHETASRYCDALRLVVDVPEKIPHPDARAKVLEEKGQFCEAAETYQSEDLAGELHKRIVESGEEKERIRALDTLHSRFGGDEYRERLEDIIQNGEKEEEDFTVKFKSGLDISHDHKLMVVCDTNVMVYKALDEIGVDPSDRYATVEPAIVTFDNLSKSDHRLLLPEPIMRELEPVCERTLQEEGVGEKERKKVKEKVRGYISEYGPDDLPLDGPIEEDKEFMKRARGFYHRHPERVRKVTKKKVNNKPEKKSDILLKRNEVHPSKGPTPGEGDIQLLAECIRLTELSIPGIWGISLLSNDSDFLDFSYEIEEELGIKVQSV